MLANAPTEIAIGSANQKNAYSIKALVLDDCQFDRARVRRLIGQTGMPITVKEIADLDTLENALKTDVFDVALIDYNLADSDGFDALEVLKKNSAQSMTACIMITGDDQSKVAVKALKSGCSDYLTKQSLSAETLRVTVLSALAEHMEEVRTEVPVLDVDKLADKITTNYSNVLQPEVAGLLRHIRTLKSSILKPTHEAQEDIHALERRCITLWKALKAPVPQLDKKCH